VVTARQAVFLRLRAGQAVPPQVAGFAERVGIEPLLEDRALEGELRGLLARIGRLA
jgi:hypothetical protein